MDQSAFVKQLLDFQKMTIDNSFIAMKTVQEQTEKIAKSFVDQANWLPEDGKKVLDQWVDAYKKGQDNYKKLVDENFKKVEEYFDALAKAKK
jgi:polyhydroxyalkanoate synthesis regulator phasin